MIGHIYRIIHIESDIQYIGSTMNEPRKRWQSHKDHYAQWLDGKNSNIAIYTYFQQHGIEKFKLIPIKTYEVADRKHLLALEQLWIDKLRCINKQAAFGINKLYMKQYRKQYRNANSDALKARDKQYYDANKESIRAKGRTQYQCDCGVKYTQAGKSQHFKTKKHLAWAQAN